MYRIGETCGLKPFKEVCELFIHNKDQAVHPVERCLNDTFPDTKKHVRMDLGIFQ